MKKYFKIWKIIIQNSYIRDSQINGVIFFDILISLFDIVMTVVLIRVIFDHVTDLAGWKYHEVLFIYCIMKLTGAISGFIYSKGLRKVASEQIRKGDYDFYLAKPANPLILVSIGQPRIYLILNILAVIGLLIYSMINLNYQFSLLNIIFFFTLFITGQILFFFLTVISVVPTFWFVRLFALRDIMNRALQFARYPAGIYSKFLQAILFAIFPILVVTYLPAVVLFKAPEISYVIYAIIITIIFAFIAIYLWKMGEKHYGSASS